MFIVKEIQKRFNPRQAGRAGEAPKKISSYIMQKIVALGIYL